MADEHTVTLAELSTWDKPGAAQRSALELVNGLRTTWQVIQDALARWTLADLAVVFQDEDEGDIKSRSECTHFYPICVLLFSLTAVTGSDTLVLAIEE